MFLFDPTFGGSFENCEGEIKRIMERAEAQIVFCRKWDERRLAYHIKGRKRGVYVLTYIKASADCIGGIERDAKLSESILRLLILRADDQTPEDMERNCTIQHEEIPNESGKVVAAPTSAKKEAVPAAKTTSAKETAVMEAPVKDAVSEAKDKDGE